MKPFSIFLLLATLFASDPPDRYPEVRKLLQSAEADSINIQILDDLSRPAENLGHLYARAGYLDASARAYSRSSRVPVALIKARVVYGDLTTAKKQSAAISDPEQRLNALLSIADVLWRMGDAASAKECLQSARKAATVVTDQAHRTQLTSLLNQTEEYIKYDPPNRLSPEPTPRHSPGPTPANVPPFPITPEGLGGTHSSTSTDPSSVTDSQLLTNLYARIAAQDRDGLARLVQTAPTPFQKTLALASIEHLLIQQGHLNIAESYANGIPETTPECVLAKAEALNSLAAEWLRKGIIEYARPDFESALRFAQSARDLPMGQVRVFVEIAEAQSKDHDLAASAEATLKLAEQTASAMPVFNPATRGKIPRYVREYYRHEAYEQILIAAVQTDNLAMARHIADLWKTLPSGSGIQAVAAWFRAGLPSEAITFTATIKDTPERVKTQLFLAARLLDEAGAPNI